MSYLCYQLFTFYGDSIMKLWIFANIQRKEEGKDQESIQSSTTPDPEHHMGKRKNAGNITYKRAKRSALSQQVTTRLQGTDMTISIVHLNLN